MRSNRYLVKGFTRTATLSVILSSALSAYYGVYLMDETDIIDKTYKVDHKSDTVSLEQGIDAYIVEQSGQLPTPLKDLKSGTYDVCKQDIEKCPEGSISLDVLVDEGYLQEIPSSYLAGTDSLTGYKLNFDSERYLISIQNEDATFSILDNIPSQGSQVISSNITLNPDQYQNMDIIIEENVTVKMNGVYKFASFTNNGKILVQQNPKNSLASNLEITANEVTNTGEINADNLVNGSGGKLKFVTVNKFNNSGKISLKSKKNKNLNSTGGNIMIVAKDIQIASESINAASSNGMHGNISLIYQTYDGPELTPAKFFANLVQGLRIVE